MDGWIEMRGGAWVQVKSLEAIRSIEVNVSGTHYEAWIRYSTLPALLIGTAPTAVRAAQLY